MLFQVSAQWMQIPAGNSHIRRQPGLVKSRELNIQLARVTRLDSRLASGEKKLLQASVPEALDHVSSVSLHDTKRKWGVAVVRTGSAAFSDPFSLFPGPCVFTPSPPQSSAELPE